MLRLVYHWSLWELRTSDHKGQPYSPYSPKGGNVEAAHLRVL